MISTDDALGLTGCEIVGHYDEMTPEEWLAQRKKGFGGSDAGAIMGMNKYSSPLALCMAKSGRMEEDDVGDIEAVKIGNLLEPLIRSHIVAPYIEEITGMTPKVIEPACMYRSKQHPWMVANLDGFLRFPDGRLVGLEIKTGSSYMLREWGGAKAQDEIPDSYYCQVQHYMAATGLPEFYVFGLIGNRRVLRIVPADQDFIGELVRREQSLWDIIERDNPMEFPAPSGSESDDKAIEVLGLPQDEGTADLLAVAECIQNYVALGAQEKEIATQRRIAKQKILAKLGQHKYGRSGGYKVTHSRVRLERLDTTRLRKKMPKIYDAFSTSSEYGRLTIRDEGGN